MDNNSPILPRTLGLKWAFTAIFGLMLWLGAFIWLRTWWTDPYPYRWLIFSGIALAYLLWVIWAGLADNHRPGETNVLTKLGLGNIISITRGFILVLFCGFLFSPWPEIGKTAWLPGLLYTMAALPDFLDGAAARLTNHVTKLGETLDVSIDSIGVLGVSLLAVQYGQVPWWYLLVGLARYLFLAGIWVRQKLNRPVYDLPFSVRRRGYAGLTMGLFFAILYPVFRPPGTHFTATVFAIYLLGGFIWDWLLTIGWLPPQPGEPYLRLEKFSVRVLPLVLRLIILIWGIAKLMPDLISQPNSAVLWIEAITVVCLITGIAGRSMTIVGLVTLGIHQAAAPLDGWQLGLVLTYTNLLFLGTGAFSLWPVENRIIFHRVGDPHDPTSS